MKDDPAVILLVLIGLAAMPLIVLYKKVEEVLTK